VLFYLRQSPAGITLIGVRLYNNIFLIAALFKKKNIAVFSVKKERKREEEKKSDKD
jgi:hypothetical protein